MFSLFPTVQSFGRILTLVFGAVIEFSDTLRILPLFTGFGMTSFYGQYNRK